jgi:predicted amidophosphoribosyltransferase
MEEVTHWVGVVGQYVVMRDCLALSFALDYDRDGGSPNQPQTDIGRLRSRAKTYGKEPTADTLAAADELAARCTAFLGEMSCYQSADAIVAMPSSRPDSVYDLPRRLAEAISSTWDRPNLSHLVRTVGARRPVKNASLDEKLEILRGTIDIVAPIAGENILLVDDIYQSGISINYVAMELLKAGVKRVFGLCVEKTCRNDDNQGRAKP